MTAPAFLYPTPDKYRWVISGFWDSRSWGLHAAIDLPCPIGTPITASYDGIVRTAGWLGTGGWSIEVDHQSGMYRTRYMHLSRMLVTVGQQVKTGQLIAYSGNSTSIVGGVGPHLHFAIWVKSYTEALTVQSAPYATQGWWAVDPLRVLRTAPVPPVVEESDLKLVRSPDGLICVAGETGRRHIKTLPELEVYQALYGSPLPISQAQMNAIPWAIDAELLKDVRAILFDEGVGPNDNRRLMKIAREVAENHAILFDDGSNDAAADKRRLIWIGNKIRDLLNRP